MADTDAKPVSQDALVADIDRTRADLARTIDAISDRVSPKRNVDRAMGEARQRVNQIGQRANQVGERVSQQVGERASQVGERASKVDPVIVGAIGAAAAVLVGVTVLLLVRRRRH
jgi:methyl-accepting chemotaxis protein